jgi:hypothetical protein
MKKLFIGLFLVLSFLTSCRTGIRQDITFEKGSYEINTWFMRSAISSWENNRTFYDEYTKASYEDLDSTKKSEYEKAEVVLNQMRGKDIKKDSNW